MKQLRPWPGNLNVMMTPGVLTMTAISLPHSPARKQTGEGH